MSSYSRQQLEAYLKTLEIKGKVLDIGGSQNPIKKRVKSWQATEYKILDLAKPHEGGKVDIVQDIQEDLKIKEKFDVVFCIEVSEYWYNPFKALQNIAKLTKNNGILYISFHYLYPVHEPKGEDCLRYTRYGIEKLMSKTGFKIEYIEKRMLNGNISVLYNYELMRGLGRNKDAIHQEQGYIIKARRTYGKNSAGN